MTGVQGSQPGTTQPELDYGYVLREAHELHRYYGVGDKHPYTCTVIADCISTMTFQAARIEELTKALREISDLYVNAPGWAAPEPSHAREYKMHQIARSALSLEDRK